ncbi:50S ribosomal protein P1 [Conexivisphaera calida]|uniref:Large ribosomal subunit protein P1 n=1 Tax=Conexivisphaera calida TaxID=1874277 RepID=A0A4P2VGA3_9ARCH|nr:LSU ribosomal protein L12a [Conexivisphaera calida]
MEYVYAALLLHKAGKGVDEDSLKKVVEAAGISADEIRIKALVAALSQVNIDEVLKSAAVMPVAAPAAPAAAAAAPAAEEKKPAKEEEAKKEEEETALEGLSSLFG